MTGPADSAPIDLGDGHALTYTWFAPDRDSNPDLASIPDHVIGALIVHPSGPNQQSFDGTCTGGITFSGQPASHLRPGAQWEVESWDPLTISPSVLCSCGDHGFVRGGRWVRA